MVHSFTNIKLDLIIGIDGEISSPNNNIRLGDVVVSSPQNNKGGVLQYDFGKTIQERSFQQIRFLNQPSVALRTALATLKTIYEADGHQLNQMVDAVLAKKKKL